MKRFLLIAFAVSVLSISSSANVFNLGPGLTNLETVIVGDPGNPGELSGAGAGHYTYGPDRVCGAVDYAYSVGKYEVTAAQYADFLNHVAANDTYGLYSTDMWSDPEGCKIQRSGSPGSYSYSVAADRANRPVNFVTFWDSLRFANWLHNGQPTGPQNASTTEDGAYLINGYNDIDGRWIQRKAGWRWAVTSEDEWYKAAYYKGDGTYWDYPMQSDVPAVPSHDLMTPDPGNNANFWEYAEIEWEGYAIGYPYYRTEVGEYENSESHYGTFDQGGNVMELNEAIVRIEPDPWVYRGVRGTSYAADYDYDQAACRAGASFMTLGSPVVGFRVSAVPEPSSLMVLAGGVGAILAVRRRRV